MSDLRQREFNSLKILHHIDRLRALAEARDVAPVTVEIDPVAHCNHACGWCVDPVHFPHPMSDELFEDLITELACFNVNGFQVEGVVFKGGGEPTLHPHFDKMVNRAVNLGFAVGVVTNGSKLTKWAEVLGKRAAYVRVSIDGPTPESHQRIHRSRDFDKILRGIDQLLFARQDQRHPIIGLSFAIDIHVIELIPEAIRLGEQLGVNYILLRPPFFEEVGSKPTMTIQEARQVRRQIHQTATEYEGGLEILVGNWVSDAEQKEMKKQTIAESGRRAMHIANSLPIEHRTGRCLASSVLAVVTADGSLYGCCNLRALSQWSLGRLDYEQNVGFHQLWHGSKRKEILAQMHQTQCIAHCTHPLSRYNEIVETLRDKEKFHSQFV